MVNSDHWFVLRKGCLEDERETVGYVADDARHGQLHWLQTDCCSAVWRADRVGSGRRGDFQPIIARLFGRTDHVRRWWHRHRGDFGQYTGEVRSRVPLPARQVRRPGYQPEIQGALGALDPWPGRHCLLQGNLPCRVRRRRAPFPRAHWLRFPHR